MKVIPLKKPFITIYKAGGGIADADTEFDAAAMERIPWLYWQNLNAILRSPINKQGGMDSEELQHTGEVSRDLRKHKDDPVWALEEEDYNFVVSKVKAFRWPTQADVYEDFLNDILHAKAISKDKVAEAVQSIEEDEGIDTDKMSADVAHLTGTEDLMKLAAVPNGVHQEHSGKVASFTRTKPRRVR